MGKRKKHTQTLIADTILAIGKHLFGLSTEFHLNQKQTKTNKNITIYIIERPVLMQAYLRNQSKKCNNGY